MKWSWSVGCSLGNASTRLVLCADRLSADHVNLLPSRLMCHDVGEKRYELIRRVPRRGFAYHFAGLRIERRVQRQRAGPLVLKPKPFGSSRRQRQHRIVAIEGLNRRRLASTQNTAACPGEVQVQPDDVGSLLLEVRIVGAHVALQPVRLQPVLVPHPRHQSCATPLSLPARRRVLRCVLPSVGGLRVALRIFASTLGVHRNGF